VARFYILGLIILLGACQSWGGNDLQETLVAGDSAIGTDAVSFAATAAIQRTQFATTVEAAGTEAAEIKSVNEQLFATIAAGSTPTVAVVPGQANPGDVIMDDMANMGSGAIITTGVSDNVKSSDGCVVDARSSFPTTTSQLFATMQAVNVEAGTPLSADWFYEGQMRVQQRWSVDLTASARCFWFSLNSAETPFTPGSWSVTLYMGANNTPIGDQMTFTITDAG
jgi:hypothetical protein